MQTQAKAADVKVGSRYCVTCKRSMSRELFATHTHAYDLAADRIARMEQGRRASRRRNRVILGTLVLALSVLFGAGAYAAYQDPAAARAFVVEATEWAQQRLPQLSTDHGPFDDDGTIRSDAAEQLVQDAFAAVATGNESLVSALTSSETDAGARRRLLNEIGVFQLTGSTVTVNSVDAQGPCSDRECRVVMRAFLRQGLNAEIYDWAVDVVAEGDGLLIAQAHLLQ